MLPNPIMTASGTSGHGDELGHYFPLSELGAVVVKSLAAFEWAGNPAPRLRPVTGGMLNSVGLQGPGVDGVAARRPPRSRARRGAAWSRASGAAPIEDYAKAASMLATASRSVVAVEVNLSCPNLDGGAHLFAHSPADTAAAIDAARGLRPARVGQAQPEHRPARRRRSRGPRRRRRAPSRWSTRSRAWPSTSRARTLALGGGGGGLSGRAIHPVAVRAVHDVHAALPDLPIVGVGGVATAADAVELMMAGASAVQVGHGDVRRSAGSACGAARAERLVRPTRDRCRRRPRGSCA